jgi:hypothetical protein
MQETEHVREHRRPIPIGYCRAIGVEIDVSVAILDIRFTKPGVLQAHIEGPKLNSTCVERSHKCRLLSQQGR